MKWTDARAIGLRLYEKFPETNPLSMRFTQLRDWVLQLDGFDDRPEASSEPILEAIQMAWYDEWED